MDSMGPKINTRTRKIGGSTVWFPRGPALKHFSDKIRPEVERILDNIELQEVEKLIVKLYMIGRSEQKANPIIMICCSDKATRKEAEVTIRESGLLDQHGNCGFGLGSTGFPLETSFLPHPLGKTIYSDMQPAAEDALEASSTLQVDVYGLTGPGIGRKLGFVTSSQSGRTIQYATGGPIMRLGGHLYQLTVAHPTNPNSSSKPMQKQDWDTDECDFDGQSDEDEDENLVLSRGSISPEESMKDAETDSDQHGCQQSPTSSDSYPEIPYTRFSGGRDLSSSLMSPKSVQTEHGDDEWDSSFPLGSFSMPCWNHGELDYLMIKLPTDPSDLSQELNCVTIDGPSESRNIQVDDIESVRTDVTNIFAITSRGPIPGDIVSDSMSFKTGSPSSFQQLLTVLMSKELREGDSGSAVIDAQTGHFYGHVILGVDGDSVAYVLPSPNILASITTQFLQLPSFYRANRDERPVPAPAAQLHRTENRTAVDSLSKLISKAGPSSSDKKVRPHPAVHDQNATIRKKSLGSTRQHRQQPYARRSCREVAPRAPLPPPLSQKPPIKLAAHDHSHVRVAAGYTGPKSNMLGGAYGTGYDTRPEHYRTHHEAIPMEPILNSEKSKAVHEPEKYQYYPTSIIEPQHDPRQPVEMFHHTSSTRSSDNPLRMGSGFDLTSKLYPGPSKLVDSGDSSANLFARGEQGVWSYIQQLEEKVKDQHEWRVVSETNSKDLSLRLARVERHNIELADEVSSLRRASLSISMASDKEPSEREVDLKHKIPRIGTKPFQSGDHGQGTAAIRDSVMHDTTFSEI